MQWMSFIWQYLKQQQRKWLPGLTALAGWRRSKAFAKVWPEKSIVYYTGTSSEAWNPHTLELGLGGAQTAVIYLAKEWDKLGYKVVVYGETRGRSILCDGVQYLDHARFNKHDYFDTLIIWEPKNLSILEHPIFAKRIWLDVHGVPKTKRAYKEAALKKVDKVFIKSKYHHFLFQDPELAHIPESKLVVVSNGIDQSLFDLDQDHKQTYRLIYASNYIRGLEQMLVYGWPIIKAAIPEAQLDIYYGWEFFDASYKNNPERQVWKQHMLQLINQPGVKDHGRVGQVQLAIEKASAAIHYYATTYREVDCISVRESAAVGSVPVTTDYAALAEKDYCVKISGEPTQPETQERVAHRIVELLKDQKYLRELSQRSKELVRHETWEAIAQRWLQEL